MKVGAGRRKGDEALNSPDDRLGFRKFPPVTEQKVSDQGLGEADKMGFLEEAVLDLRLVGVPEVVAGVKWAHRGWQRMGGGLCDEGPCLQKQPRAAQPLSWD